MTGPTILQHQTGGCRPLWARESAIECSPSRTPPQFPAHRFSRLCERPARSLQLHRSRLPSFPLCDLDDALYLYMAMFLPLDALTHLDASCWFARKSHSRTCGPWCELGKSAFEGVEVNRSLFDYIPGPVANKAFGTCGSENSKVAIAAWRSQVDWKMRYQMFASAAKKFLAPFADEVRNVRWMDQVIGLQWMWCLDALRPSVGVYTEFEVKNNPDDISVALVDPNDTSRQSVTFSPITGAVIFETRVEEAPPVVEGRYMLPLSSFPPNARFKGLLGVYVRDDAVAFFRKLRRGQWETTGYVRGLMAALGHTTIGLVLALREAGPYRVSIRANGVNLKPPVDPGNPRSGVHLQNTSAWSTL